MLERDIRWITEEPGDKALNAGVLAMIDRGLDGPDGVGRSDALAVWTAMARTLRLRFESIGEYECSAKDDRSDCQWPACGCDPAALRVIASLQEQNLLRSVAKASHMTRATQDRDVEEIAAGLTKSEKIVIIAGVTWSGTQRSRLIAKGIAPEACRGAPPRLRKYYYEAYSYDLPLTPFGLAVRAHLTKENDNV